MKPLCIVTDGGTTHVALHPDHIVSMSTVAGAKETVITTSNGMRHHVREPLADLVVRWGKGNGSEQGSIVERKEAPAQRAGVANVRSR